jgi:hypothetical protein
MPPFPRPLPLQVLAARGARCRSEVFLSAFSRAVQYRPRWLLRRSERVRAVLEAYRRLGWWPAGQVEELLSRLPQIEAEVAAAAARRRTWAAQRPHQGGGSC